MKSSSRWHYSRADLATSYLQQLEAGLNSIAIFAERRKGKTEFLLDDLNPVARDKGLRTVYINFWERKSDPVYCITQGVKRSLEEHSPSLFKRWKKEFSVKLGAIQAKASIDPTTHPELSTEALDMLVKSKDAVLIMFDEIQHLATNPEFEDLVSSLRTFLDTNKKKVRAIFTGSSQDRLNKLFRRQKAAFYRSASLVDFPDMGEDFIAFLIGNFEELTGRKLSVQKAFDIFQDYNNSPFVIVDLLYTMMREGLYDFDKGLSYYIEKNNPSEEWRDLWDSLKLIDQVVLRELILESRPLYHSDTYKFVGDILGIGKVTRGAIQTSIKRLREKGILNNEGHGQWAFESKEFRAYAEASNNT